MKFSVGLQKTYYGEWIIEADDYEHAERIVNNEVIEHIDSRADWDEDYEVELTCVGIQPYEEPNKDLWS